MMPYVSRIARWRVARGSDVLHCAAPSALAQVPGADQVQSVTLANGMQIIVWPDRDIPNVALYNWVRVGSRNEVPGITGLAHFFEHMMFNGTTHAARRASSIACSKRTARATMRSLPAT